MVFTLAITALVLFVIVAAVRKDSQSVCSGLLVHVDYADGNYFIDEKDIKSFMNSHAFNPVGKKFNEIDLHSLEKSLNNFPYVQDAEVYSNQNGELVVQIEQKAPIVRVINNYGVNYYLDKNLKPIPLSTKFTARVPVLTGYLPGIESINNKNNQKLRKDIQSLVDFLDEHFLWKALMDNVYISKNGNFECYTKLGNQNIVLGDVSEDLDEKFGKLLILYKEAFPVIGWDKYKTINLEFKDQVVCIKK